MPVSTEAEGDPDADDTIRFFRFRNQMDFDTTDEEANETMHNEDLEFLVGGPPGRWEEKEIKNFVYIDDYNCVEKLRQIDAVYDHPGRAGSLRPEHLKLRPCTTN